MEDKIKDKIEEVKNFKQILEDSVKDVEEVKNGEITENDEKQEPYYVLLNGISDSIISILGDKPVVTLFEKISKNIGDEATMSLIDLLTITMTYASYNAITFYDELLKNELTKQFDNYGEHLNATIGSVKAINSAVAVMGKRLTSLENINKIQDIEKSL